MTCIAKPLPASTEIARQTFQMESGVACEQDGDGCAQIRRFSKAAHSAQELSDLASQRGDARTALEAQAYALYMAGTLAFERQQWETALAKLLRAQ